MRTLLSHSLLRLTVLSLLFHALFFHPTSAQIPQPIGHLSDYGAVLDRHGRERIEAMIEEAWSRFGVEVFILVSWENPSPTTRAFAEDVFKEWNLSSRTYPMLFVFMRDGSHWTYSIVVGSDSVLDRAAARINDAIDDLVAHRRIEEALVAIFSELDDAFAGRHEERSGGEPVNGSRPWIIPALLLTAAGAILAVRRFVCPRCGRILRRAPPPPRAGRPTSRRRWVYFCRSCGYRREQ